MLERSPASSVTEEELGLLETDQSLDCNVIEDGADILIEFAWWEHLFRFKSERERKNWRIGLVLDAVFFSVVLVIMFITIPVGDILAAWFMPLIGIGSATIAMSTPAGGGILWFPALTLIGTLTTRETVALSISIQLFSMGIFGTCQWMQKDVNAFLWSILTLAWIGSCVGSSLALLVLEINTAAIIRIIFSAVGVILAGYMIYTLAAKQSDVKRSIDMTAGRAVLLFGVGILGGFLVGYIGFGVDIVIYVAMVGWFKIDSQIATINSIALMGWSCLPPFLVHLLKHDSVHWDLVLPALLGVLVGARIGPNLNYILGKRKVVIFFTVLLLAEFIRTAVEFGILPFASSDYSFFWD
eukprot:TRINITY_DN1931_c0_g1_i1.p1 TRINITY_DN1931_c0_g1~~TRINITY_DN1931_c0_g1_i1.p1  ORF type:complete len:355 (+),score=30.40 TRINITY_DN1931_c0_g1_i1:890-1954(+)